MMGMFLCVSLLGVAQNKDQEVHMVSHTVQMGETVRMLSKKYLVDPAEIYHYNKFAVDGIKQGMTLQIPVPVKDTPPPAEVASEPDPQQTQQEPQPETAVAQAPAPKKTKTVKVVDRSNQTQHTVQPGETLYALSRQYGISVDEIRMSNPNVGKALKVGQVVQIPSTREAHATEGSLGSNAAASGTSNTTAAENTQDHPLETSSISEVGGPTGTVTHQVAAGETLYSLAKRYKVTVDQIKAQNPSLAKHGLQVGQTLTIGTN